MVKPMQSDTIKFDEATGVGRYELNENLQRQTLLVELVAGASRSTALFYGGQITTYVSESFGQLQTTDAVTHQPISTAYVKVYAKYPDGDVRFYKDGYTDARGRFDYASVSAADAKGAERFAVLVISDEQGATLHDIAPRIGRAMSACSPSSQRKRHDIASSENTPTLSTDRHRDQQVSCCGLSFRATP